MKALVLKANAHFVYEDVDVPAIRDGFDVCLTVRAAGICRSDIPRSFAGRSYYYPIILGHEIVGVVSSGLGSGRQVVVYPLIPCGTCPQCRADKVNLCRDYGYIGSRRDGGFSTTVVVPQGNVIDVPVNMDPLLAVLTEPVAVLTHAFKKLVLKKKSRIGIIGDGPMGLILGRMLLTKGYPDVVLFGMHEHKLALAREFGISAMENNKRNVSQEHINSFDAVFELAGTNSAYESAVRILAPEGMLVLVGNSVGNITLKREIFSEILRKEIVVLGSWNSLHPDWVDALNYLNRDPIVGKVVSHRFSLREGATALRAIHERTAANYVKGVFVVDA